MTRPDTREDILSLAAEAERPWRYDIQYGPEGEANYAWVYDGRGQMICTTRTHHAANIVEAMNRAAPTPPAAGAPGQEPVAVKPLEWIDHTKGEGCPQRRLARLPFGRLVIFQFGSDDAWYAGWDGPDGKFVGSTEAEAKAAAQTDFERRIRSALVSAPPTYADAEAKGDGWHDISSAPRDGTTVDLWVDGCRRVDFYCDEHGRWTRKEGYPAVWRILTVEPTHWRPRPTEPAAIRSLASPAPKGET